MSKRVGIVGGAEEPHCVHMAELLRARGSEVVVLDTNRFPAEQDLSDVDEWIVPERRAVRFDSRGSAASPLLAIPELLF